MSSKQAEINDIWRELGLTPTKKMIEMGDMSLRIINAYEQAQGGFGVRSNATYKLLATRSQLFHYAQDVADETGAHVSLLIHWVDDDELDTRYFESLIDDRQ